MTLRFTSLLTGVLATAGLAGCGASEFHGKVVAACAPSAEREKLDCACFATALDRETDDQQKKVLLITMDREIWRDDAKKKAALDAAGIDEATFKAVLNTADGAVRRAEKECKAPKK